MPSVPFRRSLARWLFAAARGAVCSSALACALAAQTAPAANARPSPQGALGLDDGAPFVVGDPPQPGVYEDPAQLYRLRFPAGWRLVRAVDDGYVACTLSPDAGELAPSRLRVGARVMSVRMSEVFERQRLSAAAILQLLMPVRLRSEPGMKLVAGVSAATLGGRAAASCTLEGTREEQAGEFTESVLLTEQEGQLFQLTCFAPKAEFEALRPSFEALASDSRFGRAGLPRLEASIEARRLVQKYKASIVSISASDEQGGGWGTGFIVSRDGYVLTNYHVAFDVASRRPMKRFSVEWDESLRRAPVAAELVGGRFRMSPFQRQHGTDVALLKIPPGEYEPLPLSPLADVEAGDGVVTLGFPSRGMLEGLSLTVTTGVVARFNRRPSGEIDSVFVDATFTHGSSGGPCLSLVTGGVIGLTTFGTDVVLNPQLKHLNDLVNYKGVVPIDAALREFPLECLPGLGARAAPPDFMDCVALSKHFLSSGSLAAAEKLALRCTALEPSQAFAHMRLGECRVALGLDQQAEGALPDAEASFAAARGAFEHALKLDAQHAATLAAFAGMELHLGRVDDAAALAARSIASDAKNWQAQLLLADVRLRQSRYDEALQHVDKAKEVTGGVLVNPHVTAAWIHTARRDFEKARKEWAEAARISPVYLPARLGVAAYFENVGKFDEALAEYQRVLTDFRDDAEVMGHVARCLDRAGRRDEALGWFARSVQRSLDANQPPGEQVLLPYADALLGAGRDVDAIPVLALHLFHHSRGAAAPYSSLRLAAIHAQHQAFGLASAHARFALALRNDAATLQQAQQFPQAPLALQEIRYMLQFRYPLSLAVELVASSPLGFAIQSDEQLQQLRAEGLPEPLLQAIGASLSGSTAPAGVAPSGAGPGPAPAPPLPASSVDVRGTWTADGTVADGTPFRCLVILGEQGLFTSDVFLGFGSLGAMSGRYTCDGRQIVLRSDGGQEYVSALQRQGDVLVMDMPNFALGLRFVRQP